MKEAPEPIYKKFERFAIKSLEDGKEIKSLTRAEFEAFTGLKNTSMASFTQYKKGVLGGYKSGPRISDDLRKKYAHLLGLPVPGPRVAQTKEAAKKMKPAKPIPAKPAPDKVPPEVPKSGKYPYGALAEKVKSYVGLCYKNASKVEDITYRKFCACWSKEYKPEEEEASFNTLRDMYYKKQSDSAAEQEVKESAPPTPNPIAEEMAKRSADVYELLSKDPRLTNAQLRKKLDYSISDKSIAKIRDQIRRHKPGAMYDPTRVAVKKPAAAHTLRAWIEGVLRQNPLASSTDVRNTLGRKIAPSYIRFVTREFFSGGAAPAAVIPAAPKSAPARPEQSGLVSYKTLEFITVSSPVGKDVLALLDTVLATVSASAGKKYAVVHMSHPLEGLELREVE